MDRRRSAGLDALDAAGIGVWPRPGRENQGGNTANRLIRMMIPVLAEGEVSGRVVGPVDRRMAVHARRKSIALFVGCV